MALIVHILGALVGRVKSIGDACVLHIATELALLTGILALSV